MFGIICYLHILFLICNLTKFYKSIKSSLSGNYLLFFPVHFFCGVHINTQLPLVFFLIFIWNFFSFRGKRLSAFNTFPFRSRRAFLQFSFWPRGGNKKET